MNEINRKLNENMMMTTILKHSFTRSPVMMAVIVADNGNKSLRKTCQWNTYNEHGTLHDG